jgi:phosphoglycerate dehydrogenase-like enzyme
LLRADVVTLHCCLTADNRQMIDARALALMKPHAVLVNTARGPLLDVRAAADRVASGYLRGLAIDVFPEEPYPELAGLAAIEGVLLTPHAAGYTHDLGRRVADGVVKAFEAWSQGGVPEYPL